MSLFVGKMNVFRHVTNMQQHVVSFPPVGIVLKLCVPMTTSRPYNILCGLSGLLKGCCWNFELFGAKVYSISCLLYYTFTFVGSKFLPDSQTKKGSGWGDAVHTYFNYSTGVFSQSSQCEHTGRPEFAPLSLHLVAVIHKSSN